MEKEKERNGMDGWAWLVFSTRALAVKGYIKIMWDGYGIFETKSWLFAELVHQFPMEFYDISNNMDFTIMYKMGSKFKKSSTHMRGYSKKTRTKRLRGSP